MFYKWTPCGYVTQDWFIAVWVIFIIGCIIAMFIILTNLLKEMEQDDQAELDEITEKGEHENKVLRMQVMERLRVA